MDKPSIVTATNADGKGVQRPERALRGDRSPLQATADEVTLQAGVTRSTADNSARHWPGSGSESDGEDEPGRRENDGMVALQAATSYAQLYSIDAQHIDGGGTGSSRPGLAGLGSGGSGGGGQTRGGRRTTTAVSASPSSSAMSTPRADSRRGGNSTSNGLAAAVLSSKSADVAVPAATLPELTRNNVFLSPSTARVAVSVGDDAAASAAAPGSGSFTIQVRCGGMRPWSVQRRYRDFASLHMCLAAVVPPSRLPPLPSKVIASAMVAESASMRPPMAAELQSYLRSLVRVREAWGADELLIFLDDDMQWTMALQAQFARTMRLREALQQTSTSSSSSADANADLVAVVERLNRLAAQLTDRMDADFDGASHDDGDDDAGEDGDDRSAARSFARSSIASFSISQAPDYTAPSFVQAGARSHRLGADGRAAGTDFRSASASSQTDQQRAKLQATLGRMRSSGGSTNTSPQKPPLPASSALSPTLDHGASSISRKVRREFSQTSAGALTSVNSNASVMKATSSSSSSILQQRYVANGLSLSALSKSLTSKSSDPQRRTPLKQQMRGVGGLHIIDEHGGTGGSSNEQHTHSGDDSDHGGRAQSFPWLPPSTTAGRQRSDSASSYHSYHSHASHGSSVFTGSIAGSGVIYSNHVAAGAAMLRRALRRQAAGTSAAGSHTLDTSFLASASDIDDVVSVVLGSVAAAGRERSVVGGGRSSVVSGRSSRFALSAGDGADAMDDDAVSYVSSVASSRRSMLQAVFQTGALTVLRARSVLGHGYASSVAGPAVASMPVAATSAAPDRQVVQQVARRRAYSDSDIPALAASVEAILTRMQLVVSAATEDDADADAADQSHDTDHNQSMVEADVSAPRKQAEPEVSSDLVSLIHNASILGAVKASEQASIAKAALSTAAAASMARAQASKAVTTGTRPPSGRFLAMQSVMQQNQLQRDATASMSPLSRAAPLFPSGEGVTGLSEQPPSSLMSPSATPEARSRPSSTRSIATIVGAEAQPLVLPSDGDLNTDSSIDIDVSLNGTSSSGGTNRISIGTVDVGSPMHAAPATAPPVDVSNASSAPRHNDVIKAAAKLSSEADQVLSWIAPTAASNTRRAEVAQFLTSLLRSSAGLEAVTVGPTAARTYLPDGALDIAVLIPAELVGEPMPTEEADGSEHATAAGTIATASLEQASQPSGNSTGKDVKRKPSTAADTITGRHAGSTARGNNNNGGSSSSPSRSRAWFVAANEALCKAAAMGGSAGNRFTTPSPSHAGSHRNSNADLLPQLSPAANGQSAGAPGGGGSLAHSGGGIAADSRSTTHASSITGAASVLFGAASFRSAIGGGRSSNARLTPADLQDQIRFLTSLAADDAYVRRYVAALTAAIEQLEKSMRSIGAVDGKGREKRAGSGKLGKPTKRSNSDAPSTRRVSILETGSASASSSVPAGDGAPSSTILAHAPLDSPVSPLLLTSPSASATGASSSVSPATSPVMSAAGTSGPSIARRPASGRFSLPAYLTVPEEHASQVAREMLTEPASTAAASSSPAPGDSHASPAGPADGAPKYRRVSSVSLSAAAADSLVTAPDTAVGASAVAGGAWAAATGTTCDAETAAAAAAAGAAPPILTRIDRSHSMASVSTSVTATSTIKDGGMGSRDGSTAASAASKSRRTRERAAKRRLLAASGGGFGSFNSTGFPQRNSFDGSSVTSDTKRDDDQPNGDENSSGRGSKGSGGGGHDRVRANTLSNSVSADAIGSGDRQRMMHDADPMHAQEESASPRADQHQSGGLDRPEIDMSMLQEARTVVRAAQALQELSYGHDPNSMAGIIDAPYGGLLQRAYGLSSAVTGQGGAGTTGSGGNTAAHTPTAAAVSTNLASNSTTSNARPGAAALPPKPGRGRAMSGATSSSIASTGGQPNNRSGSAPRHGGAGSAGGGGVPAWMFSSDGHRFAVRNVAFSVGSAWADASVGVSTSPSGGVRRLRPFLTCVVDNIKVSIVATDMQSHTVHLPAPSSSLTSGVPCVPASLSGASAGAAAPPPATLPAPIHGPGLELATLLAMEDVASAIDHASEAAAVLTSLHASQPNFLSRSLPPSLHLSLPSKGSIVGKMQSNMGKEGSSMAYGFVRPGKPFATAAGESGGPVGDSSSRAAASAVAQLLFADTLASDGHAVSSAPVGGTASSRGGSRSSLLTGRKHGSNGNLAGALLGCPSPLVLASPARPSPTAANANAASTAAPAIDATDTSTAPGGLGLTKIPSHLSLISMGVSMTVDTRAQGTGNNASAMFYSPSVGIATGSSTAAPSPAASSFASSSVQFVMPAKDVRQIFNELVVPDTACLRLPVSHGSAYPSSGSGAAGGGGGSLTGSASIENLASLAAAIATDNAVPSSPSAAAAHGAIATTATASGRAGGHNGSSSGGGGSAGPASRAPLVSLGPRRHLFKRSLLLLQAWLRYEAGDAVARAAAVISPVDLPGGEHRPSSDLRTPSFVPGSTPSCTLVSGSVAEPAGMAASPASSSDPQSGFNSRKSSHAPPWLRSGDSRAGNSAGDAAGDSDDDDGNTDTPVISSRALQAMLVALFVEASQSTVLQSSVSSATDAGRRDVAPPVWRSYLPSCGYFSDPLQVLACFIGVYSCLDYSTHVISASGGIMTAQAYAAYLSHTTKSSTAPAVQQLATDATLTSLMIGMVASETVDSKAGHHHAAHANGPLTPVAGPTAMMMMRSPSRGTTVGDDNDSVDTGPAGGEDGTNTPMATGSGRAPAAAGDPSTPMTPFSIGGNTVGSGGPSGTPFLGAAAGPAGAISNRQLRRMREDAIVAKRLAVKNKNRSATKGLVGEGAGDAAAASGDVSAPSTPAAASFGISFAGLGAAASSARSLLGADILAQYMGSGMSACLPAAPALFLRSRGFTPAHVARLMCAGFMFRDGVEHAESLLASRLPWSHTPLSLSRAVSAETTSCAAQLHMRSEAGGLLPPGVQQQHLQQQQQHQSPYGTAARQQRDADAPVRSYAVLDQSMAGGLIQLAVSDAFSTHAGNAALAAGYTSRHVTSLMFGATQQAPAQFSGSAAAFVVNADTAATLDAASKALLVSHRNVVMHVADPLLPCYNITAGVTASGVHKLKAVLSAAVTLLAQDAPASSASTPVTASSARRPPPTALSSLLFPNVRAAYGRGDGYRQDLLLHPLQSRVSLIGSNWSRYAGEAGSGGGSDTSSTAGTGGIPGPQQVSDLLRRERPVPWWPNTPLGAAAMSSASSISSRMTGEGANSTAGSRSGAAIPLRPQPAPLQPVPADDALSHHQGGGGVDLSCLESDMAGLIVSLHLSNLICSRQITASTILALFAHTVGVRGCSQVSLVGKLAQSIPGCGAVGVLIKSYYGGLRQFLTKQGSSLFALGGDHAFNPLICLRGHLPLYPHLALPVQLAIQAQAYNRLASMAAELVRNCETPTTAVDTRGHATSAAVDATEIVHPGIASASASSASAAHPSSSPDAEQIAYLRSLIADDVWERSDPASKIARNMNQGGGAGGGGGGDATASASGEIIRIVNVDGSEWGRSRDSSGRGGIGEDDSATTGAARQDSFDDRDHTSRGSSMTGTPRPSESDATAVTGDGDDEVGDSVSVRMAAAAASKGSSKKAKQQQNQQPQKHKQVEASSLVSSQGSEKEKAQLMHQESKPGKDKQIGKQKRTQNEANPASSSAPKAGDAAHAPATSAAQDASAKSSRSAPSVPGKLHTKLPSSSSIGSDVTSSAAASASTTPAATPGAAQIAASPSMTSSAAPPPPPLPAIRQRSSGSNAGVHREARSGGGSSPMYRSEQPPGRGGHRDRDAGFDGDGYGGGPPGRYPLAREQRGSYGNRPPAGSWEAGQGRGDRNSNELRNSSCGHDERWQQPYNRQARGGSGSYQPAPAVPMGQSAPMQMPSVPGAPVMQSVGMQLTEQGPMVTLQVSVPMAAPMTMSNSGSMTPMMVPGQGMPMTPMSQGFDHATMQHLASIAAQQTLQEFQAMMLRQQLTEQLQFGQAAMLQQQLQQQQQQQQLDMSAVTDQEAVHEHTVADASGTAGANYSVQQPEYGGSQADPLLNITADSNVTYGDHGSGAPVIYGNDDSNADDAGNAADGTSGQYQTAYADGDAAAAAVGDGSSSSAAAAAGGAMVDGGQAAPQGEADASSAAAASAAALPAGLPPTVRHTGYAVVGATPVAIYTDTVTGQQFVMVYSNTAAAPATDGSSANGTVGGGGGGMMAPDQAASASAPPPAPMPAQVEVEVTAVPSQASGSDHRRHDGGEQQRREETKRRVRAHGPRGNGNGGDSSHGSFSEGGMLSSPSGSGGPSPIGMQFMPASHGPGPAPGPRNYPPGGRYNNGSSNGYGHGSGYNGPPGGNEWRGPGGGGPPTGGGSWQPQWGGPPGPDHAPYPGPYQPHPNAAAPRYGYGPVERGEWQPRGAYKGNRGGPKEYRRSSGAMAPTSSSAPVVPPNSSS